MTRRTTARWRLATLAAALALAGCAALRVEPTDAAAGVAVPGGWSAGTAASRDATSLAAWLQRFGDPTLTALVEQALAANTDIASAQAALRQARALAQVQQARLGPSADVSASPQRSRSASASDPSDSDRRSASADALSS